MIAKLNKCNDDKTRHRWSEQDIHSSSFPENAPAETVRQTSQRQREEISLIPHEFVGALCLLQTGGHSTSPCGTLLFMHFSGESQG
jgi:hypothetical protein